MTLTDVLATARPLTRPAEFGAVDFDLTPEEARALRVWSLLRHAGPWREIGGAYLARVLHRLGVPVLDTAAVRAYQDAACATPREERREELLAEAVVEQADGTFRMRYASPGDQEAMSREEAEQWARGAATRQITFSQRSLHGAIPAAGLDALLAIAEAVGPEAFGALEQGVEVYDTDPFLFVACGETKYYLAAWDEPGFHENDGIEW